MGTGTTYDLPGSGTAGVSTLSSESNVGVPGLWVYRVDGSSIVPGGGCGHRRHCFYIWMCPSLLSLIVDVDECLLGISTCARAPNGTCTNTIGSYLCSCNPGYSGDGRTCVDIDECDMGTHNCSVNANCTNTVGSFSCSCNYGYIGDGHTCSKLPAM